DYVSGTKRILATVFSKLAIHIATIQKSLLLLKRVPLGQSHALSLPSPQRPDLAAFPSPQLENTFELAGDHAKTACADIVISGLAWVAFTGRFDKAVLQTRCIPGLKTWKRDPLLPFEYTGYITKYKFIPRKRTN